MLELKHQLDKVENKIKVVEFLSEGGEKIVEENKG